MPRICRLTKFIPLLLYSHVYLVLFTLPWKRKARDGLEGLEAAESKENHLDKVEVQFDHLGDAHVEQLVGDHLDQLDSNVQQG